MVVDQIFGKKFQGHAAIEPRVLGLVNHSHAATANFLNDAVVRDGSIDDGSRIGHRACIL